MNEANQASNRARTGSDDSVKVKICGVGSPSDYDACRAAGASFIGMVFHPASPRHLEHDAAAMIADHADRCGDGPQRVALCVDMDDEGIERMVESGRPDQIQLHGGETPERAAAIKGRFGLGVIKAIGVEEAGDIDACQEWKGIADWLLFDAKGTGDAPAGGSGTSFDWRLLGDSAQDIPWMLAGGLNAGNVARALAQSGARAVDVSSGVETAPGRKDAELIRAFANAARLM